MVHELPQTTCLVLCKRKLVEVAVYSFACSNCCRNKHLTPDYCGNVLESKGIGAGSFPIGCEGFVKASKVQGSSLLLSNANNCRILIYIYMYMYVYIHIYIYIVYIYYSIGYDSVYIYIIFYGMFYGSIGYSMGYAWNSNFAVETWRLRKTTNTTVNIVPHLGK